MASKKLSPKPLYYLVYFPRIRFAIFITATIDIGITGIPANSTHAMRVLIL